MHSNKVKNDETRNKTYSMVFPEFFSRAKERINIFLHKGNGNIIYLKPCNPVLAHIFACKHEKSRDKLI